MAAKVGMWLVLLLLHNLLWLTAHAVHNPYNSQKPYRAAVFEFSKRIDATKTAAENLEDSLMVYRQQAQEAQKQLVDILLFPEFGMLGVSPEWKWARDNLLPFLVPVPMATSSNESLCGDETVDHVIRCLACTAMENHLYLAVHLGEVVWCNNTLEEDLGPCPNDGRFQFSTEVVFDRSGALVARYRKINLHWEPYFDVPINQRAVTFTTDFGTTFGVLICFDVVNDYPTYHLYRQGVTNFILSVYWADQIPFNTAIQTADSFARGLNVTVLLSGLHYIDRLGRGSGVFVRSSGPRQYVFDWSTYNQSKLIMVDVDDMPSECNARKDLDLMGRHYIPCKEASDYFPWREDFSHYSSAPIESNAGTVVCNNDLCCNFTSHDEVVTGRFRLLAFSGKRPNGTTSFNVQKCAVAKCSYITNISTCGTDPRFTDEMSNDIFPPFSLTANFTIPYTLPSIVSEDMQLIVTGWTFNPDERTLTTSQWTDNLFVAAAGGRFF